LLLVGYEYDKGEFKRLQLPNDELPIEGLLTHYFGYDVVINEDNTTIQVVKRQVINSQYGQETESLLLSTLLRPILTWSNVTTYTMQDGDKLTKMYISNKKNIERGYFEEIYNNFLLTSYVTSDEFSTYYNIDEIKKLITEIEKLYEVVPKDKLNAEDTKATGNYTEKLNLEKTVELLNKLGFVILDDLPITIKNNLENATITYSNNIVSKFKHSIITEIKTYFQNIIEENENEKNDIYVTNVGFFTGSGYVRTFVRGITENTKHKLRSLDFLSKSLKRLYSGVNSNHISNVLQDILGIQVIQWNDSKLKQLKAKIKKILNGKHRSDLINNSLIVELHDILSNANLNDVNKFDLLTEMQYTIYDAFMLNESVNLHETSFINDRIVSFLNSYQDEFKIGAGDTNVQRQYSSLVYYPMHPTSVSKIVRGLRELKYFSINPQFKQSLVLDDEMDVVINLSDNPKPEFTDNRSFKDDIKDVAELSKFMKKARSILSKSIFNIVNLEYDRVLSFYKQLSENHATLDSTYNNAELKKLVQGTSFIIFNYLNDSDVFIDIDESQMAEDVKKHFKANKINKVLNFDKYGNNLIDRIGFLVMKEVLVEVNSISDHITKELVRPDNYDNFVMKNFREQLMQNVEILPNTLDKNSKKVKTLQRFETRRTDFIIPEIRVSEDNEVVNDIVKKIFQSTMERTVSLPNDSSTTLLKLFNNLQKLVAAYKSDNNVTIKDIKDIDLNSIVTSFQGFKVTSTLSKSKNNILLRETVDNAIINFNNLFKKSVQIEYNSELIDLKKDPNNAELVNILNNINLEIFSFGAIKTTKSDAPIKINISPNIQYKNPTIEEKVGQLLSYDYPFIFTLAGKSSEETTIRQLKAERVSEDMLNMAFFQKFNTDIGKEVSKFLNNNNNNIEFEGSDEEAIKRETDILNDYKPKELELALYDDYEFKTALIRYLVFEYTINNKISLTNQFNMFYGDPLSYAKYNKDGKLIVDDFIFNFYKRNTFGRSPSIPKNVLDRPATADRPYNHFMNGYIGDINGPSYELYKHIFVHESDGNVFKNLENNQIILFPETFHFKNEAEQKIYDKILKDYKDIIKKSVVDSNEIKNLYFSLSSNMQGQLMEYFNKHIANNAEKFKTLSNILQEAKPYLKLNHTDASDFATFEFFLEKAKSYGYVSYDLANRIIKHIHDKVAEAKIALENNTIDDDLSVLDYVIDEEFLINLKKELEESIVLKHSGTKEGTVNINKKSIKQFSLMDLSVLVMKDVYVGFVKNEKLGIEELLFDKNATRVLIPNSLKHSKLDMLRKIMEMQGIDRISHPSAIKTQVSAISYPKVGFWQSKFKNAKEALLWAQTPNNITVLALDYKNYGEQTPQRESDKSIFASQVKSLIHLNQGDLQYVTKYVNGKRVKSNITGTQHYKDMQGLWKSLYKFQYDKLLNKIMDPTTDTVSHSKLVDYILESLNHSKGITDNDRNAFLSIENILKAKFTTITKNSELVNAINDILNSEDNSPNKIILKDFLNSKNIDDKDLVKFAIPLLITPNSYKLQAVLNSLVKTKLKSFGTKGVLVPDIQNTEDVDWADYESKMVLTNPEMWDGSQKLQDMRISNGEIQPAQVVLSWNFKANKRKFYNFIDGVYDITSFRKFDKMITDDVTKVSIPSKYQQNDKLKNKVLEKLTEEELEKIESFAEQRGLKINKLIIYKIPTGIDNKVKIYIEHLSESKEILDINDYVLQEGDVNYQKNKMILNTSLLPPEVLRGFGNRIPTQEQSSMVFFEIVGFITGIEKSMLIAPSDFLVRMGSDFDIDTLYSLLFNNEYDPFTGKLILESYYESESDEIEQQLRYIRYIEKKYLNRLTKDIDDSYFNKFKDFPLDYNKFLKTFTSNFYELLDSEKYNLLNSKDYKSLIILKTLKSKATEGKMNKFVGSVNKFIEDIKNKEENETIAELLEKLQDDIENLYNDYDKQVREDIENYKNDIRNSLEYKFHRAKKLAFKASAMNFEKFIKKPLSFQNGLLALENKIKDGFVTVLIQPDNLKTALASLDYGLHFDGDSPIFDEAELNKLTTALNKVATAKEKETIIMNALEKYSMAKVFEYFNKSTIKKDPLNWLFNIMMYDSSRTSATIIGAMALTQVGLAAIAMAGRKFTFNTAQSLVGNNIIVGKDAEGNIFTSNDFTDIYLIDDGTNKGFIYKGKDGSTYISLGVDDQKNQVLQRINASLLNLNSYIGFLANGFKSHWAVLITNQPVIKKLNYEYLKATSEKESASRAFKNISTSLLLKYIELYRIANPAFGNMVTQMETLAQEKGEFLFPIDYIDMFINYTYSNEDALTIVGLFDSIMQNNKVKNEDALYFNAEYIKTQILSLYNYIMAFEQGKAFGDFFRKTNVDSQGPGPYYNSATATIDGVSSFFKADYPFKGIGNVYGDNYFLKFNPYIRKTSENFKELAIEYHSLYEFIQDVEREYFVNVNVQLPNVIVNNLKFSIESLQHPTTLQKVLKEIANSIIYNTPDFSYVNNTYVQPEYTIYEKIYFLRVLYKHDKKMDKFLEDLLEDLDSPNKYSSKLRYIEDHFDNVSTISNKSANDYVKKGLKEFFKVLTNYHDNMRISDNILIIPNHFKYYAINYGSMAIARTFSEFFQYDSTIYRKFKGILHELNNKPIYQSESVLKLIDKYVIGYLSAFKESIDVINRKSFSQEFIKKFTEIQRYKPDINSIDADYTRFMSAFAPKVSPGVSLLIYDKGLAGVVEDLFRIMEKMFLDNEPIPNMQNYTFSQFAEDMFRYWIIMNGMQSAYRNVSAAIPNSILAQTSLASFFRTLEWNNERLIYNDKVLDFNAFGIQAIQHNAATFGESIVVYDNILKASTIKKITQATFTRSQSKNTLMWAFQADSDKLDNLFYVVTNKKDGSDSNSVFINLEHLFRTLLTDVSYNNDKDFEKLSKEIMINLITANKEYLLAQFGIDSTQLDNFLKLLKSEKDSISTIYIQIDNLGLSKEGHKVLEFNNVRNSLMGFSIEPINKAPLSTLLLEKYLKLVDTITMRTIGILDSVKNVKDKYEFIEDKDVKISNEDELSFYKMRIPFEYLGETFVNLDSALLYGYLLSFTGELSADFKNIKSFFTAEAYNNIDTWNIINNIFGNGEISDLTYDKQNVIISKALLLIINNELSSEQLEKLKKANKIKDKNKFVDYLSKLKPSLRNYFMLNYSQVFKNAIKTNKSILKELKDVKYDNKTFVIDTVYANSSEFTYSTDIQKGVNLYGMLLNLYKEELEELKNVNISDSEFNTLQSNGNSFFYHSRHIDDLNPGDPFLVYTFPEVKQSVDVLNNSNTNDTNVIYVAYGVTENKENVINIDLSEEDRKLVNYLLEKKESLDKQELTDEILNDLRAIKYELSNIMSKYFGESTRRNTRVFQDKIKVELNNRQIEIVDKAVKYGIFGDPNEFMLIQGKAGTGKTFIVPEIIHKLQRQDPNLNIGVAALSNKAKKNLLEKLKEQGVGAKGFSIAKLLGAKRNDITGIFTYNKTKRPPIKDLDIIIIDEVSMLDEYTLLEIFKLKRPDAKVIFIGDIGQIGPIRSLTNDFYKADNNKKYLEIKEGTENKSPLFNLDSSFWKDYENLVWGYNKDNIELLYERIRQGEESPILPYADIFWENSQKGIDASLIPTVSTDRKNIIRKEGSLLFTSNFNDLYRKMIPFYEEMLNDKNKDIIRFIAHTNNKRSEINERVHASLFGDNAPEYAIGELVIFNSSFELSQDIIIDNAEDGWITGISPLMLDEDSNCHYYVISIDTDEGMYYVPVLARNQKENYRKYIDALENEASKIRNYNDKLERYKYINKRKYKFADVDYGYALTAHKAQGSTYDIAVVDETNILENSFMSNSEKSEMIYTSLTRPRYMTIIFTDPKYNPNKQELPDKLVLHRKVNKVGIDSNTTSNYVNKEDDSISHVNIYSRGKTPLGQVLSNFAHTPITVGDDTFESVESWWYWTKMNKINDSSLVPIFDDQQLSTVKTLVGNDAKTYFRNQYTVKDTTQFNPTKEELKQIYLIKLEQHPRIIPMLLNNTLPFAHYYIMKNKDTGIYEKVDNNYLWTADLWREIKEEMKNFAENQPITEPAKVFILDDFSKLKELPVFNYNTINTMRSFKNYYTGNIIPEDDTVFVFGSNPVGINGKLAVDEKNDSGGAAAIAQRYFGVEANEIMNNTLSKNGKAYGLVTVTSPGKRLSKSREEIIENIKKLYDVAKQNPNKTFKVAYRNTDKVSLNGYTGIEMIEMFNEAGEIPFNIMFSQEWNSTRLLNNKHHHFGNPFIGSKRQGIIDKVDNIRIFGTIQEAAQAYKDWLLGKAHQEIEPEQRKWILSQIESGNLNGKTLLYYEPDTIEQMDGTTLKRDKAPGSRTYYSHADVLAEIINESDNTTNDEVEVDLNKYTNHSGGAPGVDLDGDDIGRKHGFINHTHYYSGVISEKNAPGGNKEVTPQDYKEGAKKVAQAANKMWANNENGELVPYKYATMNDDRLIRNWSQVKYSEGIYAIAPIGLAGDSWREDVKKNKANPRILLKDGVQGGTGYAVEMGVQNGNKVYVFNTIENSKYKVGWYQIINGEYIALTTVPILTKNYAIIGSRDNSEIGKQAIEELYQNTINNLSVKNIKPKPKTKQLNVSIIEQINNAVSSGKTIIFDYGINSEFFVSKLRKLYRKFYLLKQEVDGDRFKVHVSLTPIVNFDINDANLFTPELTTLLNPVPDTSAPVVDYENTIRQQFKDAVKLKLTTELLNEITNNGGINYIIKGKINNYKPLMFAPTENDYKSLLAEAYAELLNLDVELVNFKTTVITATNYSFKGTYNDSYEGLNLNKNNIENFIIFNANTDISKNGIIKINRTAGLPRTLPSSISFKIIEEIDKSDIIKIKEYDKNIHKNVKRVIVKNLQNLTTLLSQNRTEKIHITFQDSSIADDIDLLESLSNYSKNNILVNDRIYLEILKYKILKETKLQFIGNNKLKKFKYFKVQFINPTDNDISLSYKTISNATKVARELNKLEATDKLEEIKKLISTDENFAKEVASEVGISMAHFNELVCRINNNE
jgi:hypothetical protein